MAAKKEKKRCFLISPIGEEDSETRIRADWLMNMIVKPVLEDQFDYEVERSDGNYQPGIIDDQIFDSISSFDLIIANLTELNANVFYELGISHSMGRPVIQMAETGVKVPFDTVTNRVIFYGIKRTQEIDAARRDLVKTVKAVEANDYVVENPFTRYRGRSAELADATPFQRQVVELVETFPNILSRLGRLEVALEASDVQSRGVVRNVLAHGFLGGNQLPIATVLTGGIPVGSGQGSFSTVDLTKNALLSVAGVTTEPPLPLKEQDEANDGHDE